MGKRLVRIFNPELKAKSDSLKGKEADVVLTDKTTFHGEITEITEREVILKDRRSISHKIEIKKIDEVIYDLESSY
jgi:hypothetical protein